MQNRQEFSPHLQHPKKVFSANKKHTFSLLAFKRKELDQLGFRILTGKKSRNLMVQTKICSEGAIYPNQQNQP